MVSDDAVGYLDVSSGREITRGRLQEEKWLLGTRVTELLDVFGIVSANSDDLEKRRLSV